MSFIRALAINDASRSRRVMNKTFCVSWVPGVRAARKPPLKISAYAPAQCTCIVLSVHILCSVLLCWVYMYYAQIFPLCSSEYLVGLISYWEELSRQKRLCYLFNVLYVHTPLSFSPPATVQLSSKPFAVLHQYTHALQFSHELCRSISSLIVTTTRKRPFHNRILGYK